MNSEDLVFLVVKMCVAVVVAVMLAFVFAALL